MLSGEKSRTQLNLVKLFAVVPLLALVAAGSRTTAATMPTPPAKVTRTGGVR
jgi:hypothetical protein